MNAVDASAINTMLSTCTCVGFAPAATWERVDNNTVTVTEASTYASGDAIKRMNVEIYDEFGKSVYGTTATAGADVEIDVGPLNQTKPLNVKVTISSTGGCVSDGSAKSISVVDEATGPVGNWDKDFTSSEAANISAPTTLS